MDSSSDDETIDVTSYIEPHGGDLPVAGGGLFTAYLSDRLGPAHPLVAISQSLEDNMIQRDDVIVAIAARHGIYIPPVDYGDKRGFYSSPDGNYVVREFTRRLKELADSCVNLNIPPETVRAWKTMTPEQVASLVRASGMEVDDEEVDEEYPYYRDRLALNAQLYR